MGTETTDETEGDQETLPGVSLLRPGIMSPREYQLTIVKDAVEKNTLVVLPTGLGKTLVSVLAAAQLLERNCDMRVLIMAPTRPLVLQHRASFEKLLDVDEDELVQMTGEVPPDLRQEQWSQGRIFFTTPQVVENDIAKGRLTLKDFCLVVFDEAHRAIKDYAYTAIARHYMEKGVYPLLLGLTASPGGNAERVLEVCEALSIEKIIYRTNEDEDVSPYVHNIETEWREVDLPHQYEGILLLLRRMVEIRVDKLRAFLPTDGAGGPTQYIGKRLLLTLGDRLHEKLDKTPGPQRGPIFGYMMIQSSALSLLHGMELLESQGIRSLMRFLNRLEDEKDDKKAYKNIIKDAMYPEMYKAVVDNIEVEHPKVEQLKLEIIKQYSKDKKAKILVFTQYRDSAALLSSAIKNDVFVVERFVGQASKLGDKGMDQDAQREILDRFRNGEITVLVATSVAEEGLDIPDVDLVIFYEPIPSEIRFIQRKGRTGRSRVGKVVLLATVDSIDTAYYHASQRKIKRMREIMSSINTTLGRVQRGPRPPPTPVGAKPRPIVAEDRPQMQNKAPTRLKAITNVHISPMGPTATSEARIVRDWILDTLENKDEEYVEDLFERGSEEGMTRADMYKTLEELRKDGLVFKPRWDLVKKIKAHKDDKKGQLEVTVLKVTQGCAQLLIDGETEALLEPEEFPGNLSLIKKGKKFRVHGVLYGSGGKKHLRVLEVFE
jgi:ERCC4-related helicase